jgi:uncharacterized protein DUF6429
MEFDKDKVDSITPALLHLVTTKDKYGYRAWKGFDWDTMDRLYEKGYISNPKGKAKSVALSEEGTKLSAQLFKEYFEISSS